MNLIEREVETNALSDEQAFLQFDLGNESYAIRLLSVKEVIPVPETTHIPNSPSYYIGIMNLRGQIISIIDLRKKLKTSPKELGLEEAVIIVEYDDISIGVIVDSINHVLNFSCNKVLEIPEIEAKVNVQYIQGVYKKDEQLTMLLDLERVFNIQEIKRIRNSAL